MPVKSPKQAGIAQLFEPHVLPASALSVRCHVLNPNMAQTLEEFLVRNLPWCYTTKDHVRRRQEVTSFTPSALVANKVPDPGSVMSGEFGEITTLFLLASEREESTEPIRKWRYKQDRNKATPYSDVVIFYREKKDAPSPNDFVICAESKQKSTPTKCSPIEEAVEGFRIDSTGRLARTLIWLREKAIDHESAEKISFIERFTSDLLVEYKKHFKAVAVIDRSLLDRELTRKIELPPQDASFEVMVLGIADLKALYERVFSRAIAEVTI